MNTKEKIMIEHYKKIIENRSFDEYDIFGFLILIRRHIPKGDFPLIIELADTVGHREKNIGMILKNIKISIEKNYIKGRKNKITNYVGYSPEKWNNEWTRIMNYFNISVDKMILKELTLCVFSLFQEVEYKDKTNNIGKLRMLIDPDNNKLLMYTTEAKKRTPIVCFTYLNKIIIKQKLIDFIKCEPAETFRENGILKLKNEKGIICEIV